MVRLSKIYTKFGDKGDTMLGDGSTQSKAGVRVESYGAVDEANAAIGMAASLCSEDDRERRICAVLVSTQQDMFDVGADLCAPIAKGEKDGERLRVTQAQIDRLERLIDEHNAPLRALDSFVLPGGSRLAAALHVARTAVRRAERETVRLLEAEGGSVNRLAAVYLNRLSDLLFVLAREANDGGAGDVLWVPGANRA